MWRKQRKNIYIYSTNKHVIPLSIINIHFFYKKGNRISLAWVDIFNAYMVYMYEMITWQHTCLPIIFPLQPFRSFQRHYHALPNNRKGRKKSSDRKFACRKIRLFENDRAGGFSWSLYDPLGRDHLFAWNFLTSFSAPSIFVPHL